LTNPFSNRKIPVLELPLIKDKEKVQLDFVIIVAGFSPLEDTADLTLATANIKREVGPNGDERSKGP
jgi:hypothetical protein